MRVLVAEDNDLAREILAALVESLGHDCIPVVDGEEAWEKLLTQGAEVVISDWHMPKLDGVQLCQRVRASPEIEYPYFILLTAISGSEGVHAAAGAGVDTYLSKPVDLAVLEAELAAAQLANENRSSR